MGSEEEFELRSRTIAQRFLQTAVVVDDEAYIGSNGSDGPKVEVVAPGRNARASRRDENEAVSHGASHALDAGTLIGSFSALGVICGVVSPTDAALETMRQADIVILDWRLKRDKPEFALDLLRDLLTGETDRNSLRLVAIYTGEARLEDIRAAVFDTLKKQGLEPKQNKTEPEISFRHGRVVLYAKSDVNLAPPLNERSVSEEDFPKRLVGDFASMTAGLLPGIALTSLTAVREGAHKVLDRFSAELDPAFLAHKACLPEPEDAERQIVNHVAEELRGLMDNAVAEESPSGADAVEGWIRRKGDGMSSFTFDGRELDMEQAITLARKGIGSEGILSNKQQENAFRHLSACFAAQDVANLDQRLAWIMSFRTVYSAPPPTLWLGTVVTASHADGDRHLICMRPRCDCVRLNEETMFFFLPLVDPKEGMDQIVVSVDDGFERLGIDRDPSGWVLCRFNPTAGSTAVAAAKRESDGGFEFADTSGNQYKWRGELKAEYAQRIAQTFGGTLSRVAVDESEWLRRSARKGR